MFTRPAVFCLFCAGLPNGAARTRPVRALADGGLRAISIDLLNFSSKTKRISDAQKKQLMASGREGAQAFLAQQPKPK